MDRAAIRARNVLEDEEAECLAAVAAVVGGECDIDTPPVVRGGGVVEGEGGEGGCSRCSSLSNV